MIRRTVLSVLILFAMLMLVVPTSSGAIAESPMAGQSSDISDIARTDPAAIPMMDRSARVDARIAGTSRAANVQVVNPTKEPELTNSGRHPYGGEHYGALRMDGNVNGCSTAVATRSSTGAQYVYSAGHCVLDDGNGTPEVSPTVGEFWWPYTACISCNKRFGANGHGGSTYSTSGDRTFIRAGISPTLYREIQHYDGSVFTATGVGNPVMWEQGACACGRSFKLIHGFVSDPSLPITNIGPRAVGNLALMQVDYPTEGCPIPGDSGSAIVGGHDVIGTATAVTHDSQHCWIWFSRAGTDLGAVNQVLAPAPPA